MFNTNQPLPYQHWNLYFFLSTVSQRLVKRKLFKANLAFYPAPYQAQNINKNLLLRDIDADLSLKYRTMLIYLL